MPTAGPDLIPGYDPNGPGGLSGAIIATRVATFFTQPVFVCAPPGDTSRLFVVERTGAIKIIDLTSGQVLSTPFLDVSSQILTDGERGLLGLAFDPNFATNGFFYVNLSSTNGNTEIRRYQVSSNPNVANPASATTILSINQSEFNNHKGGWLGFGPDGDLYISVGDGGGSGNPLHTGQDINSLRGKILRIDVDSPPDPGLNYHIPADNPFVGQPGAGDLCAGPAQSLAAELRPCDGHLRHRPGHLGRDRHPPKRRQLRLESFRGASALPGGTRHQHGTGGRADLLI